MSGAYADSGATTTQTERPEVSGSSVGELIGEVTNDFTTLMRQELDLAKAEIKQEVSKAGKGAGMLGAAGSAGYMTVLFLSITLWWALGDEIGRAWAALVVALLWGIVAGALAVIGKSTLAAVSPKPERTVQTLKEVPDALKGR